MEQYIKKSDIEKEIKRKRNESWLGIYTKENGIIFDITDEILSFLDTLEVKDEDELENLFQALPEKIVDKKSHQVYELSIYHYDGQCVVDYIGEIDHDSLYTFSGNTLYEAIEKAWSWLRENSTGR